MCQRCLRYEVRNMGSVILMGRANPRCKKLGKSYFGHLDRLADPVFQERDGDSGMIATGMASVKDRGSGSGTLTRLKSPRVEAQRGSEVPSTSQGVRRYLSWKKYHRTTVSPYHCSRKNMCEEKCWVEGHNDADII